MIHTISTKQTCKKDLSSLVYILIMCIRVPEPIALLRIRTNLFSTKGELSNFSLILSFWEYICLHEQGVSSLHRIEGSCQTVKGKFIVLNFLRVAKVYKAPIGLHALSFFFSTLS